MLFQAQIWTLKLILHWVPQEDSSPSFTPSTYAVAQKTKTTRFCFDLKVLVIHVFPSEYCIWLRPLPHLLASALWRKSHFCELFNSASRALGYANKIPMALLLCQQMQI